jgi:Ca2+-binding EF-hand superfamily protein
MLDPNGEGAVSKHDTVPLIAKRLETKETTDQLIAAFRVFDKQNRGGVRAHVQRVVAFPDSQLHAATQTRGRGIPLYRPALARLPWVELS